MTQVSEIRNAAKELAPSDRAELAVFLLGSLENTHHWVEDDEVMRRRDELDSGEVEGISREEFNRQCGRPG